MALQKRTPHLQHQSSFQARSLAQICVGEGLDVGHKARESRRRSARGGRHLAPTFCCILSSGASRVLAARSISKHRLQRRRQQRRKHGGDIKNSICFLGHLSQCRSRLPKHIPAQRWLGKTGSYFGSSAHSRSGTIDPVEQAAFSIRAVGFIAGVGHSTPSSPSHRSASVTPGVATSIFAAPRLQLQGSSLCLTDLHDGELICLKVRPQPCGRGQGDAGRCQMEDAMFPLVMILATNGSSLRVRSGSSSRELRTKNPSIFLQISSLICLTGGHRRGGGRREPSSLMAACPSAGVQS